MRGTIALIHSKYVVLNQKKRVVESSILSYLLPDDIIEYDEIDSEIHIRRLLARKRQFFMAIVNEKDDNCVSIFSYGLPKFFRPAFPSYQKSKIGDVLIIEATIDGMLIYRSYGSIKNRLIDKQVITDLYHLNAKNAMSDIPLHYTQEGTVYYTKEFRDLSHLHTFNVDPTHSKDFDDAISIENNKIYVHIVDAHSMIPMHSKIEKQAFSHAFTLYLPEGNQNILPQELAEDKLSLVKGEPRNVITIEYSIDETFQVMSYEIYPSSIVIKERYDYADFGRSLNEFPFLVQFTQKWKKETLPVPHVKLDINENGKISNHYYETNVDQAHKIIETLMILTNMTISQHVPHKIPQRYHTKIKQEHPVVSVTDNEVVNSILTVKKYRNAVYDSHNSGHFGLKLSSYTHFTSPIRRYFDVILHRMLAGYHLKNLDAVLEHVNQREHSIDQLVTVYRTLKILDYMEIEIKDKNKPIQGYILSTTDKGVVVLLEDFLYEAFVFTTQPFTVGEKVSVMVTDVSWLTMSLKIKMI
jgi:exoribonuclease R